MAKNSLKDCAENFYEDINTLRNPLEDKDIEAYRRKVRQGINVGKLQKPADAKPGFVYYWVASDIENKENVGRVHEMTTLYGWHQCICKDYPITAASHGLPPDSEQSIRYQGSVLMALPQEYWQVCVEERDRNIRLIKSNLAQSNREDFPIHSDERKEYYEVYEKK